MTQAIHKQEGVWVATKPCCTPARGGGYIKFSLEEHTLQLFFLFFRNLESRRATESLTLPFSTKRSKSVRSTDRIKTIIYKLVYHTMLRQKAYHSSSHGNTTRSSDYNIHKYQIYILIMGMQKCGAERKGGGNRREQGGGSYAFVSSDLTSVLVPTFSPDRVLQSQKVGGSPWLIRWIGLIMN